MRRPDFSLPMEASLVTSWPFRYNPEVWKEIREGLRREGGREDGGRERETT